MKWFKNLKIGTRLSCGFFLVILVAAMAGYLGIENINVIEQRDKEMYELNTAPLGDIGRVAVNYQKILVNLRDIAIVDKKSSIVDAIDALNKDMENNLSQFEGTITDETIQKEFTILKTSLSKFKPKEEEIINLALANQGDQAIAAMRGEADLLAQSINVSLNKLLDMTIALAKDKSDSNTNTANAATSNMLICIAIGIAIAIIIGLFITRQIVRPVNLLNKELRTLAERGGDLTQQININSKDEIGQLAGSVNKFLANLRTIMKEVTVGASSVAATSEQLSASSQQTAAGANETAATMGEIATSVEQVTANVQKISEVSEIATDSAKEGRKGITRVTEQMENITNSALVASKSINELSNKLQEINRIVEMITVIADQTNLLALNAAIEAARAGEQGRGFAVVAEEVRKLAEQSADATKDIYSLIIAIQTESSKAVESMADGSKEIEAGTKIVKEVGDSFKEIINVVQSLTSQIQDVTVATEQMSSGVQNVAASTEEQTASMEEVSASAESLSKLAEKLSALVGKFVV